MVDKPARLTLVREGETVAIDLATTDPVVPRSLVPVSADLLHDIDVELARLSTTAARWTDAAWSPQSPAPRPNALFLEPLQAIGRVIFSRLFPEAVRHLLARLSGTDLLLRLDDQLLHIPWELAFDGHDFLLTKFRIARQVLTRLPFPLPLDGAPTPDAPRKMLVVLDPIETLAGAEEEAENLCALLHQYAAIDVALLGGRHIRKLDLLKELYTADLVHYAGHATCDPTNLSNSGWLLHDGVLTAADINCLERAPRLVFANACQAGTTGPWSSQQHFAGEALGVGSGFLRAGVKNYIGNLWMSHDTRSATFALAFYQSLLCGQSLGAALWQARHQIIGTYGWEELLWAGHLHYGDPTFRLLTPGMATGKASARAPTQDRCDEISVPGPAAISPLAEAASVAPIASTSQGDTTLQPARRWGITHRLALRALVLGGVLGAVTALWLFWEVFPWLNMPSGAEQVQSDHSERAVAPRTLRPTLLEKYQQAYDDWHRGHPSAARAGFSTLSALPDNPLGLGYDGLAAVYLEAELHDKAQGLLHQALARNPSHGPAYLLQGDIFYTQSKKDKSLHACQRAAQAPALLPWQHAAAQTALGVYYSLQDAPDKAREAFKQAIARDPTYYQAYSNLGYLAWKAHQEAEASQWFAEAAAHNPTDEVVQYYRSLLNGSITTAPAACASHSPCLLLLPMPLAGGHLRQLGAGEALTGLVAQALHQQGKVIVLEGHGLESALQGRTIGLAGHADAKVALNVGKLLGADLVLYGRHWHYANVLILDVWAVRVKTLELVLPGVHIRAEAGDKLHTAAQALAGKLSPLVTGSP